MLALGGSVFGWTASQATSFELLDAFAAHGGNFVDTADVYCNWVQGNNGGESETIIGRWLKRSGKRSSMVIATKVGMRMGRGEGGLSKSYIVGAVEDSLRRLQTEYIDLYQSHVDDPKTRVEETLEAYACLLRQGKIRAIGASNFSPDRLSSALTVGQRYGLPKYQSFQPLYNLYDRGYECSLETICQNAGLGVLAYFPLASGFLTGKYHSERDIARSHRVHLIRKYLNSRGFRILRALGEVANEHQVTPAAVALGWLLTRPSITAPIVSATNLQQLRDLFHSLTLKLDDQAIEVLNRASVGA